MHSPVQQLLFSRTEAFAVPYLAVDLAYWLQGLISYFEPLLPAVPALHLSVHTSFPDHFLALHHDEAEHAPLPVEQPHFVAHLFAVKKSHRFEHGQQSLLTCLSKEALKPSAIACPRLLKAPWTLGYPFPQTG